MDYQSQSCDPNKIAKGDADNILSSNFVYTSLLRVCEEADANYFDVQSTAVAAKDDFSVWWNEQTQTHSKLADINLDDIEMNDELLDKLVSAMLQENPFILNVNSESSNLPIQTHPSCNQRMRETNSTIGAADNTLQVWQKLIENDNTFIELSNTKLKNNQSMDQTGVFATPRQPPRNAPTHPADRTPISTRLQQTVATAERGARTRKVAAKTHAAASRSGNASSGLGASSTAADREPTNAKTDRAIRKRRPTTASTTRSAARRRGSAASTAASTPAARAAITPQDGARYNLRARNYAASSLGPTRIRLQPPIRRECTSASTTSSSSRRTPRTKGSPRSGGHRYFTRSRTAKKRDAKLAVVLRRARMSMIARMRHAATAASPSDTRRPDDYRRSGGVTPERRLEPRRLSTGGQRLREENATNERDQGSPSRAKPKRAARRR